MSKIHGQAALVVEILAAAHDAGLPAPREIGFAAFLDTIDVRFELATQAEAWAKWLAFPDEAREVRHRPPSAETSYSADHYTWCGPAFGASLRLVAVLIHYPTARRTA